MQRSIRFMTLSLLLAGILDAPAFAADPIRIGTFSWRSRGAVQGYPGTAVAHIGDVNGDGYDEIAMGAPVVDRHPGTPQGAVLVYFGGPGGPEMDASWKMLPSKNLASLTSAGEDEGTTGRAIAGGDVNGDGFADVVIGVEGLPSISYGAIAVFLGSPAGLPEVPQWLLRSDAVSARTGVKVAVTDLNGDGFDEIVTADAYDGAQEGAVFVYPGGPTAPAAPTRLSMGQPFASFGWDIAGAGDVDGDGFGDLLVATLANDGVRDCCATAYLFRGSAIGVETVPAWEFRVPDFQYGIVRGLGDVNADGFDDVLYSYTGMVHVFHGSPSGPALSPTWQRSSVELAAFGRNAAGVGDVDNDGFDDLVVGAPDSSGGTDGYSGYGAIEIYLGGPAGLSEPVARAYGPAYSDDLGTSVAPAGDVNQDGLADILVGVTGYTKPGARIYQGHVEGLDGIDVTPSGLPGLAAFGRESARAGDVDGDGYDDFLVSAPTGDGVVHLYRGGPLGMEDSPAWELLGQPSEGLGRHLAAGRDIDGDGYPDALVVSSSGVMQVFRGGVGGFGSTPDQTLVGTAYDQSVALADVNSDGFADAVINPTETGSVRVHFGSSLGLSSTPDQTFPFGSGVVFDARLVAGEDIDQDGFDDAVFEWGDKLYLHRGGPGGLEATATWVNDMGVDAYEESRLALLGDTNGDGHPDFAMSAPPDQKGVVMVVLGTSTTPTAGQVMEGRRTSGGFGAQLAAAGDVNGDGYMDMVVGGREHALQTQGLYLGGPQGFGRASWQTPVAWGPGMQVMGAGDLDGDGFDDVVFFGNNGHFVLYGSPNP